MSLKPKFIPHMEALVRQYEAANPTVKIEWIDFPWDIIQTKLITRIVAGTPPALVNLNVPWTDELARDGLLQPLDALLANDTQRYLPSALADLRIRGQLWGFPLYSNVAVIAYNSALFQQAGLQHGPTSFDQQLAFARQIASSTGRAGIAPALAKIDGLFLQQGLPLIQERHAVFNSPAHIALIQKLAHTYRVGGLLKEGLFADDNFPFVIDAYQGGRLAMLLAPPTALKRIQSDTPALYAITDVAPAPLGPTGIADGGWLINFSIPRGVPASRLAATAKFALYLTNDTNQLAFAKLAHVFPTTVAAANDAYFVTPQETNKPNQPNQANQANQPNQQIGAAEKAMAIGALSMRHSRTLYVTGVDDYDELRRVLAKAVEAGVTGKQDIKTALDEAARIWNRKLAKQTVPL